MVNDDGFDDLAAFGHRVGEVRRLTVIEHEMTHHFARFRSRTFSGPSGSRVYDNDEHCITTTMRNLLRAGGAAIGGPPPPLFIPGGAATPGTEKAEIFTDRILTGLWNSP